MKKPRTKINAQVRRMFGLAAPKAKLAKQETKDCIELIVHIVTNGRKDRISELTFDEANDVIKALGGDPLRAYGNSKRSENYRKQAAGIKSIETAAHLDLIHELASLRNMTDEGLAKLAARMNTPWPPQTTEHGNRIVEALKAMNKRDNLVAFPKPAASSDEPSFRRVA